MKFGSNVPMKIINWQAIAPNMLSKSCVWSKCQTDELPSEDIFAKLAENFCLKPAKKLGFGQNSTVNLRVLDTRAAQALLILLRVQQKNSSHEQLKQYILHCDTSMLNVDSVGGLIKCIPQPHQIEQLKKLKKDGVKLVDAEEFLASLCDIERLIPRLNSIKFKIGYNDMVQNLQPDISVGMAACEEVIASYKFAKIIALILSIGNYMNSHTANGHAVGFELRILAKLNDIRGTDNKQTIVTFLVDTIESQYPELLNFGDDLIHVNKAASLKVKNVEETIQRLKEATECLDKELEYTNVSQLSDDRFADVMSPFSRQCWEQLEILTKMMNDMQNAYKKVSEYFTFDISKYPMEQCFSDIKIFKDLFAQEFTKIIQARDSTHMKDRPQQYAGMFIMKGDKIFRIIQGGLMSKHISTKLVIFI